MLITCLAWLFCYGWIFIDAVIKHQSISCTYDIHHILMFWDSHVKLLTKQCWSMMMLPAQTRTQMQILAIWRGHNLEVMVTARSIIECPLWRWLLQQLPRKTPWERRKRKKVSELEKCVESADLIIPGWRILCWTWCYSWICSCLL